MNPSTDRRLSAILAAAVTVFAALVLTGHPTPRSAVVLSNLVQIAAPLLAAGACWLAAGRSDARRGRGWQFLAASAASWRLGQVVWTLYDLTGAAVFVVVLGWDYVSTRLQVRRELRGARLRAAREAARPAKDAELIR